jgi:hypothetical protein
LFGDAADDKERIELLRCGSVVSSFEGAFGSALYRALFSQVTWGSTDWGAALRAECL